MYVYYMYVYACIYNLLVHLALFVRLSCANTLNWTSYTGGQS